jgi:hypothetical protein
MTSHFGSSHFLLYWSLNLEQAKKVKEAAINIKGNTATFIGKLKLIFKTVYQFKLVSLI